MSLIPPVDDWDDPRYAAEMTERQFLALARRLAPKVLIEDLLQCRLYRSARHSPSSDEAIVRRWLINGWNTEHILFHSSSVLEGASGAALQWTFPQAYYAAFASTLAYFQVAGHTNQSHAAVQKHLGELTLQGKYPDAFCFAATGTVRNLVFHGLLEPDLKAHPLFYDPDDSTSVDQQIRQFLGSTRRMDLERRKPDFKFKTTRGKPLRSFREGHWERVADRIGPTSFLSLLYRKRIKANYRDIDTFTESGIDPTPLFDSLQQLVSAVSLVHEALIGQGAGWEWLLTEVDRYVDKCPSERLLRRRVVLQQMADGRVAV